MCCLKAGRSPEFDSSTPMYARTLLSVAMDSDATGRANALRKEGHYAGLAALA